MNNSIIAMDKGGNFRVYLSISTDLVKTGCELQECTPTSAVAFGRVLTAAGLIGIMEKEEEVIDCVHILGSNDIRQLMGFSNHFGETRGFISNPYVDRPPTAEGKWDVGGAIGNGTLTVRKEFGGIRPYSGRVHLITSEIAEDLASYFNSSEQTPSAVSLGVRIGEDGKVENAAGLIVQMLPGASEEALEAVENNMMLMDALTLLVGDAEAMGGECPVRDLLGLVFKNIPPEYMPEVLEERNLSWKCDCSRQHMGEVLMSLKSGDIRSMLRKEGQAEIVCQFCRTKYVFGENDLKRILEAKKPRFLRKK